MEAALAVAAEAKRRGLGEADIHALQAAVVGPGWGRVATTTINSVAIDAAVLTAREAHRKLDSGSGSKPITDREVVELSLRLSAALWQHNTANKAEAARVTAFTRHYTEMKHGRTVD